jgi:hypothetical protein
LDVPLFEFICKEMDQFTALDLKPNSNARGATDTRLRIGHSPQTSMGLSREIEAEGFDKRRLANVVWSDNDVESVGQCDLVAREETLIVIDFK